MTTIAATGAQWVVIASLCDCGHVALTIAAADTLDPNASAQAEHDEEVVVYGDDCASWPAGPLPRCMRRPAGRSVRCALSPGPRTATNGAPAACARLSKRR